PTDSFSRSKTARMARVCKPRTRQPLEACQRKHPGSRIPAPPALTESTESNRGNGAHPCSSVEGMQLLLREMEHGALYAPETVGLGPKTPNVSADVHRLDSFSNQSPCPARKS